MKIESSQTRWLAQESTRKVLRRVSTTAAVLTVLAAAIGVPVVSPQHDSGTNPVLAIARADCPPDCGGGPGNGGTPSGPPGGGTEFVPPSMPAMPSYEPGRGQPPLDQNNGVSIYNSAAPQPSQAAQPSQPPVQNQDGSFNRASNGEQQPVNYNNAPGNQEVSQDWQQLSDRLNNQMQGQPEQQQPAQNNEQQDQSQKTKQDRKQTCESVEASVRQQFSADLFELTEQEISQAQQEQNDELQQDNEELQRNGLQPKAGSAIPTYPKGQATQMGRYYDALTKAYEAAGLQCASANTSTPAAQEVKLQDQDLPPAPCSPNMGDCSPEPEDKGHYVQRNDGRCVPPLGPAFIESIAGLPEDSPFAEDHLFGIVVRLTEPGRNAQYSKNGGGMDPSEARNVNNIAEFWNELQCLVNSSGDFEMMRLFHESYDWFKYSPGQFPLSGHHDGMESVRRQLSCHFYAAGITDPNRSSWNLEPRRGLDSAIAYTLDRCNVAADPPPGVPN
ncbi:MAG: DUF2599 domain-containing protein [Mycobacterium sp.]